MFVHLLIFVCACAGLGMADESSPPYVQYRDEIEKAEATLDKNILSMASKIPYLNDPRRQFAEIFHVVNYAALAQTGCLIPDYLDNYQNYLNSSSPEALSKPQLVIDEVNELLEKFKLKTSEVYELLKDCVGPDCDAVINALVKKHPEKYAKGSEIYLLGGAAASELNANTALYEERAKNLDAHEFLLKGAKVLESYVSKLAALYRELKDNVSAC